MKREEAIAIARTLAKQNDWRWEAPISALLRGRIVGPRRWTVRSNSNMRGANVQIEIDDRSGAIVRAAFLPR